MGGRRKFWDRKLGSGVAVNNFFPPYPNCKIVCAATHGTGVGAGVGEE
jgi:hypothetical protein